MSSPTEQRPLSRYRVLPSISRRSSEVSDEQPLTPSPPPPVGDPAPPAPAPRKPPSSDELPAVTLNLALRLPDGRRVQADFSSGQRLDALLEFALQQMGEAVTDRERARRAYELLSVAERKVLRDWTASLQELGVQDRSLYILQETE